MPRRCVVCGNVLTVTEEVFCARCLGKIKFTNFWLDPKDNPMAREYWLKLPVEYAGALYYYSRSSLATNIVKALKYQNRPDIGVFVGRILADKFGPTGMFGDIDIIVPIPLTRKRQRERGYNQSEIVARTVGGICGVRVDTTIVSRTEFMQSQTHLTRADRMDNVENRFRVEKPAEVAGKHVMIVDDVVTTGATTVSCGKELVAAGASKISILSICFVKK